MKTFHSRIVLLSAITSLLMTTLLPRLMAADTNVTGNLTVSANTTLSGDLEVWSNTTLGTKTRLPGNSGDWHHFNIDLGDIIYTNSTATYLYPGFNISVSSNASTGIANVTQTGYSLNTTWVWQENLINSYPYYNGTNYKQMQLTDTGALAVFNATDSTFSNITIDPVYQTISFFNNIGGTSVNITHSGTTLVVNSSGIAFGSSSSAGSGAIALGNNSVASGNGSLALLGGNVTSTANGALALGGNSVASGVSGLALGGGNVGTAGIDGLALGGGSFANATGASAFGNGTTALAWSSMTVGHFNANVTGNTAAWASTSPAFIVGVGNSGNLSNGLVILNNGIIYAGTGNNSNLDSTTGLLQGYGSRLEFVPQKSAFLAGTTPVWFWNFTNGAYLAGNTAWDYGNIAPGTVAIGNAVVWKTNSGDTGSIAMGDNAGVIGDGSVAMGKNASTIAGSGSVAIGGWVSIWGLGSVAIGRSALVNNDTSVAIGNSVTAYMHGEAVIGANSLAGGDGGVALGQSNTNYGSAAAAIGQNNTIPNGAGVLAEGKNNYANGDSAIALGSNNSVSTAGYTVVAIGSNNTVSASSAQYTAIAFGSNNTVNASSAVALGSNLTLTSNATGTTVLGSNLTVDTDHALVAGQWAGSGNVTISGSGGTSILFALGNGTSNTTLSNAFTVLKNGNTTVSGNTTLGTSNTTTVTVGGNMTISKRQGDIIMGSFGNGGGD